MTGVRCIGCGRLLIEADDRVLCDQCAETWRNEGPDALPSVLILLGERAGFYDRQGRPLDEGEVMAQLATNRRVADDWLELDSERVRVVTTYVGIEHGRDEQDRPLIFETVVMGGPDDHWVRRYASESEAKAGHALVLVVYSTGHTLRGHGMPPAAT